MFRIAAYMLFGVGVLSLQADENLITQGKTLFQTKICFTCHQVDPAVPAPAGMALKAPTFLGDFWGKEREVHKGLGGPIIKVKLDDEYFIESLKKPLDKVVKGALAPMPPPPPVTDDELKALLAYVKSLSKAEKKK
jgi:mono/diheme cytochrome c family protein